MSSYYVAFPLKRTLKCVEIVSFVVYLQNLAFLGTLDPVESSLYALLSTAPVQKYLHHRFLKPMPLIGLRRHFFIRFATGDVASRGRS